MITLSTYSTATQLDKCELVAKEINAKLSTYDWNYYGSIDLDGTAKEMALYLENLNLEYEDKIALGEIKEFLITPLIKNRAYIFVK